MVINQRTAKRVGVFDEEGENLEAFLPLSLYELPSKRNSRNFPFVNSVKRDQMIMMGCDICVSLTC